ncbi:MAG: hypothetical protein ACREAC_22825, partial [Blastocatellia bacterium]
LGAETDSAEALFASDNIEIRLLLFRKRPISRGRDLWVCVRSRSTDIAADDSKPYSVWLRGGGEDGAAASLLEALLAAVEGFKSKLRRDCSVRGASPVDRPCNGA